MQKLIENFKKLIVPPVRTKSFQTVNVFTCFELLLHFPSNMLGRWWQVAASVDVISQVGHMQTS